MKAVKEHVAGKRQDNAHRNNQVCNGVEDERISKDRSATEMISQEAAR
jgi:hypothetical protein